MSIAPPGSSPRRPSWTDRVGGYGLAAVSVALTLAVPLLPHARDSFPLSTYPMFSRPRGELTIASLRARGPGGGRLPVEPRDIGSAEVLQAKAIVDAAVRGGDRTRQELCRRVAQRLAKREAGPRLTELELVRRRVVPLDYLLSEPGDATASARPELLARCRIPTRARGGDGS